ncbi:MAG: glycosyltransferase [Ginsengibacter sp.]
MKPTLLIIIDNLKRGGAEILLTGILPDLNKSFFVVLVTLSEESDFKEQEIVYSKKYSLGFKGKHSLVSCIIKLKKIIKQHNPSLIHSHLFFSSLIARVSCPKNIPLIYSLHNEMSKNVFNGSKIFTFLEKITIRPNHYVMAVSKTVLEDYQTSIGEQKRKFVLPNYVSNEFFSEPKIEKKTAHKKELKLVAVGNIKRQKNYQFLIKAFQSLKNYPVTLDIYGQGMEKELISLQNEIKKSNLPIFFKGGVQNIYEFLPSYDLYVSSSTHEGFGISVAEAMAVGLPLILSDLQVFHEISYDNALFFDLNNPDSFAQLVIQILNNKHELNHLSKAGIEISKKYTREEYLDKLFEIYSSVSKPSIKHFSKNHA